MADITVVAGSVARTTGSTVDGTAGATIAQGKCVYLDTAATPNVWKLAQAITSAALAGGDGVGIALNSAASGQPIRVQTDGSINLGATLVVGQVYAVSAANAGGVAPYSDLASTNYVTLLGVATTAALLKMQPLQSGIVKP